MRAGCKAGPRWLVLCVALTTSCRTGSDGDPWAELYANDDDDASDDDDDDASDDDASDDDNGSPSKDDDLDDADSVNDDASNDSSDAGIDDTSDDVTVDDDVTADDDDPLPGDDTTCTRNTEICDNIDNDCDDKVDEGFTCLPDPGVLVGAEPFTGGVYFDGTTSPGQASADAIQRFWPTVEEGYINGFGIYDNLFRFRRTDWQLFMRDNQGVHGTVDGYLPTPNCTSSPIRFDFDATSAFYYICDGSLYREDQLIASDALDLLGVTDDGRAVGVHRNLGLGHWQDGVFILSSLEIPSSGPDLETATVQGNVLVFPYIRGTEIAVLKFDAASEWSVMKLQPIGANQLGAHLVATPDGSIFMTHWDPDKSAGSFLRILHYTPEGEEVVAWHPTQAVDIKEPGPLFAGPLDPALILR